MRASFLFVALTVAFCVTGSRGASAQEADRNQEVREIQEPAPEAQRLELTNPDAPEADEDPVVGRSKQPHEGKLACP